MEQNYRIVFTAQRQVTYEPCEMPVLDDDSMLFQAEISQISTGTELTMLERNVEPGTPWARDISYPCYPGYATVSKVIAVGKNVPAEYLGRRALVELNHQKYHAVNMHDFQKYIFIPDGISSAEASQGISEPAEPRKESNFRYTFTEKARIFFARCWSSLCRIK